MTGDLPLVAIVGRPNVGKSTLMNRVLQKRVAIVEERPGVTRDRKEVEAEWLGRAFRLVDTGGWLPAGSDLDEKVSAQSETGHPRGRRDAVRGRRDGRHHRRGRPVGGWPRGLSGQPVLLVANKVDDRSEAPTWELLPLGLGEPQPITVLDGRRTGDMLDLVLEVFPDEPGGDGDEDDFDGLSAHDDEDDDILCSVALVGRPNVGKSTLFNRLIGEDRSVVHDMPGTTRDSVDTVVDTEVGRIRFVDTAGMRRRSRIDDGTEYFSMVRALKSVDTADVALLVIDATEGVTHQDQRLAERVEGAGCPVVVLLNKWELLDEDARKDVLYQLGQRLHFLGEAAVLRISALNGRGVHRLLPALAKSIEAYSTRVPTRRVNEVVRRRPTGPAGSARRPHPVRHPGCGGPADVHPVLQQDDPAELRALHRTDAARGVQPRGDSDQDEGPAPWKLTSPSGWPPPPTGRWPATSLAVPRSWPHRASCTCATGSRCWWTRARSSRIDCSPTPLRGMDDGLPADGVVTGQGLVDGRAAASWPTTRRSRPVRGARGRSRRSSGSPSARSPRSCRSSG